MTRSTSGWDSPTSSGHPPKCGNAFRSWKCIPKHGGQAEHMPYHTSSAISALGEYTSNVSRRITEVRVVPLVEFSHSHKFVI